MLQVRAFPNRADLRYEGKAHNQIGSAIRRAGLPEIPTNIAIDHTGYTSPSILKQKHMRTFDILLEEIKENPDDDRINLYLGLQYERMGRYEQAITHIEKGISALDPIKELKPFGLYQGYHAMIRIYRALEDLPNMTKYWKALCTLVGSHPTFGQEVTALAEDLNLYDNYMVMP